MSLSCRAAVLHHAGSPLSLETILVPDPGPGEVLVRMKAAGLCHTDLEVIEGSLRYPMPIVLGHEAAGVVEAVGPGCRRVAPGESVVLSWNPHCGHCFYCDRDLPILCEDYQAGLAAAESFPGGGRARLQSGGDLRKLMFLGAFADYCLVAEQQAVAVPRDLPFEQACLIGCGVMTGAGAALNIAEIAYGDLVAVIGCGAVGLAAVQGARMAGAGRVVAIDLDDAKLSLAGKLGATDTLNAYRDDPAEMLKSWSGGRGADVVLESAGSPAAFRLTAEMARPGGQVIWLGKTDVDHDVAFRWGALMGEKRIRRSSYGGARPLRDFPLLAQAALDGRLDLGALISRRIGLDEINEGFAALKRGEVIRCVVSF